MNACLLQEIHKEDVLDYMVDKNIDSLSLSSDIDELLDNLLEIKQNQNNIRYSINALTTLRF